MMFARVVALSCLALGADAFFMGTPLRTPAGVCSSRTVTSMKVPTDHPEIEVCMYAGEKRYFVFVRCHIQRGNYKRTRHTRQQQPVPPLLLVFRKHTWVLSLTWFVVMLVLVCGRGLVHPANTTDVASPAYVFLCIVCVTRVVNKSQSYARSGGHIINMMII